MITWTESFFASTELGSEYYFKIFVLEISFSNLLFFWLRLVKSTCNKSMNNMGLLYVQIEKDTERWKQKNSYYKK
jgi:hypothetical protein